MNDLQKKILKCSGILFAIGAVGALLITGTNALTADKIAQNEKDKTTAGYKVIFANVASVSDSVKVSGTYVSSFVVASDSSGAVIGNIYTGTASYGQTTNMKIMVGISSANGATVLGKISIINNGATGGFDTTVVSNYVTPYNANPSDTTLANTKCGATAAATAIKLIVSEAKDLYESGGAVEDIDGEIKTLFANAASHTDAVDVTGKTYITKYYAVYSDDAKSAYIGTAYRLSGTTSDGNAITLLGAISGTLDTPVYGKLVSVKSVADLSTDITAYNASPSATQFDSWSNATAGVLAKAMMAEAATSFGEGTGNLSEEGRLAPIFSGTKAFGDSVAVTSQGSITAYRIAYSETAQVSAAELGYVMIGTSSATFSVDTGETHTAHITLAVGMSGDATNPVMGKLVLLSDDSFDKTGISGNYVTDYNANPSEATLDATADTGATHSAEIIKTIVTDAYKAYKSIKGGN